MRCDAVVLSVDVVESGPTVLLIIRVKSDHGISSVTDPAAIGML